MHPTCQCVLSQKNPDDSDVCRTRPLGSSDAIDTSTVDERSKDELAALVLWGCCEDSNGEGGCAERMPPHRDIFQTREDAHSKGVDHALIKFILGLEGLNSR